MRTASTRLLIAISQHGFGHLAQTAPLINALHRLRPELEFTIWSGLPGAILAARIQAPFHHRQEAADVGLVMHDAVHVDRAASCAAYLAFHHDWSGRVRREAEWLRAEGYAGVVSNVAALPLAAAVHARLPGIALCSLNWVDIAGHYLAEEPGMATVLAQMAEAYQSAQTFLRVTPALPMTWLENSAAVPPIAMTGVDQRTALRRTLGLATHERLVLIGLGGIGYQSTAALPRLPQVRWLVPDGWNHARDDHIPFAATGLDFLDLFASADALITKAGYGSFVEAAALGLPTLYIDRPDWPETPWLGAWLQAHNRAAAISEQDLLGPQLGARLEQLMSMAPPPRPTLGGEQQAVQRVLAMLTLTGAQTSEYLARI